MTARQVAQCTARPTRFAVQVVQALGRRPGIGTAAEGSSGQTSARQRLGAFAGVHPQALDVLLERPADQIRTGRGDLGERVVR